MSRKQEIIDKCMPDLIEYPHYDLNNFQLGVVHEAMDEFAEQEAVGFFIGYALKMVNFLHYIKDIRPIVTSKEIEEKIIEHEGKSIKELYQLYKLKNQ